MSKNMRKANIVKIGGTVVSLAIILGMTLPSTPWIDENRAIYISVVALIALIFGGLMWFLGVKMSRISNKELKLHNIVTVLEKMDSYLVVSKNV
jgi:hypothetical protein